jgi:protein gp37
MGESTGIEWTDATWNPWRGCTKVSPGCAHCYMFREQTRYGRDPKIVTRAAPATFMAPLKWRGPKRVFTCSWSDFFHEYADPWRNEAWGIIRRTPNLTYQILTKRPERIEGHLPDDWGDGYENVWVGVSGETHEYIEKRAPYLVGVPIAHRFLSAEPWLEEPVLSELHPRETLEFWVSTLGIFDWVILGGESGTGARRINLESVRMVRDACVAMRTPFFLKQLGGPVGAKGDHEQAILDGRTWKELPDALNPSLEAFADLE